MSVDGALRLCGRGEHRSPAIIHKVAFLLSYFSVTKSTKSHQRERSPLFENLPRVHELVARAVRGECVRHGAKRKSAVLRSPKSRLYHACEHITRESRADSCTHGLHARYKCRAGVGGVCTLTGKSRYFLFCLLAVLGLYLVGVGASTTRYLVGANIVRPRRNMKKLFLYRTFQ